MNNSVGIVVSCKIRPLEKHNTTPLPTKHALLVHWLDISFLGLYYIYIYIYLYTEATFTIDAILSMQLAGVEYS